MVGRVLRGLSAGGEADAHVVFFRDSWKNLPDIVQPDEVLPPEDGRRRPVPEWLPPELLSDADMADQELFSLQLERDLQRLEQFIGSHDDSTPLDPRLRDATVVGYYALGGQRYAVLDHQRDGFDHLGDLVLSTDGKLPAYMSVFHDGPPPYPSRRLVDLFVEDTREHEVGPELFEVVIRCSPRSVARAIRSAGPLTEDRRQQLIDDAHQLPYVSATYPTVDAFAAAVEQQLRQLRLEHPRLEPEQPIGVGPDPVTLPRLPRTNRDLTPAFDLAAEFALEQLPASRTRRIPSEIDIDWTERVNLSTLGTWTLQLTHRGRGTPKIRINRLLRTSKQVLPDERLAYLIYHELLHQMLPGHGHDAEFRRLEVLWPGAAAHDA